MKKLYILSAALLAAVSCQSLIEEWQPVFTGTYEPSEAYVPVNMDDEVNTTIAQLCAMYTSHGKPVQITDDIVIKGQVTTSDEAGNVYREIYIQDETGAIDLKLGKSSSYDDYKVGQILYVRCYGLALGEYGYKSGSYGGSGLLQLGMLGDGWKDYFDGTTTNLPDYETAYIDSTPIINQHIFRGEILPEEERIKPVETLSGADLTKDANVAKLVTLKGCRYGNSVGGKEIFCLFYPDPNLEHANTDRGRQNRVFLSSPTTRVDGADYTFGITTWALTKLRFTALVESGIWDNEEIADGGADEAGNKTFGTRYTNEEVFGYKALYKQAAIDHAGAQSVSHYFMYDGVEVQVRSSGYARFADYPIPADVLSGSRSIDFCGILSRYQGSAQFTLLDTWYSDDPSKETLLKL